ncbi:MAG: hypothetical protein B6U68_02575 [Candidatus Aenigmarchaeota archaeon ex4484_14]|nr:MAG: hypothetical protein B6U68_02575 [Candidatus Aenigmarchaeota archaeon ex4484_14]
MLEIVAAFLIAFALLALFRAIDRPIGNLQLLIIILTSLACFIASYLLFKINPSKLVGGLFGRGLGFILLAFGVFMVLKYPDILKIQDYELDKEGGGRGFTTTGIFIGLMCLVLGIYWLVF